MYNKNICMSNRMYVYIKMLNGSIECLQTMTPVYITVRSISK